MIFVIKVGNEPNTGSFLLIKALSGEIIVVKEYR
jgi:hypothetical protein